MHDGPADRVEDGPGLVEVGRLAADHDGQHGVAGAGLTAGDRGVEHPEALLPRLLGQVGRRLGGCWRSR